jgi:penicillin amidase
MQNDRYSVYAKKVSRLILPALQSAPDSGFATAIDYLKHWDFTYDVSETAASIFDSFMLHLSKNVFEGEMKAELYHQFINFAPKPRRILLRFLKGDSLFVDNKHIPQKQFKSQLLRKSMRQTIQWLKGNYGDEPAKWRWGNLHTITLKPPLLGKAAEKPDASNVLKMIVKHLFDKGPYPAPGNATTLDNGTYSWYHPFDMTLGPSIRRIVNLGNMRRSLSILPTGQSGNPFSDFYGNQTKSWLHGQYKTLYQDSSLFKHYTLMVLVPSGF